MAVRDRSTRITYTNELNTDGIATQKELNDTLATHITNYHLGDFLIEDGMEFFLDPLTNKYISTDWYRMNFFSTATAAKNLYMTTVSAIASNLVPITLPFNYNFLISKVQVDLAANTTASSTFKIENNSAALLSTITIPTATRKIVFENLNIQVPARIGIQVYINAVTLNRPVVTIWCRLIRP